MEQEELDYLFQSGEMPAWAYYQMSDKPVWMKAQEQHNRLLEIVREREAAREAQEAEEKLTKELEAGIEKAVEDLLSGF